MPIFMVVEDFDIDLPDIKFLEDNIWQSCSVIRVSFDILKKTKIFVAQVNPKPINMN